MHCQYQGCCLTLPKYQLVNWSPVEVLLNFMHMILRDKLSYLNCQLVSDCLSIYYSSKFD